MVLFLKSSPPARALAADNARLRAALRLAIDHLTEDQGQAGMPTSEQAEDRRLIAKLKEALGQ